MSGVGLPGPVAGEITDLDAAILWRTFTAKSGLLVAVKDDADRYIFVNQAFVTAFGLQARFRPGATDFDLFPAEVANALRGREHGIPGAARDQVLPFPDGGRTFLMEWLGVGAAQEPAQRILLAQEITGRLREESDVLASRALFKGILDIAADAIISIDHDQSIIGFNQGAERIFQYSAEEVLNRPLEVLLPEPTRPAHRHHLDNFDRSGVVARQMGQRGSISGRRKDGTIFPAEASISRIDAGGRAIYTAILRDVTQARQAEEEIKALNLDLRRRAIELENVIRELESFSYSVSHDLRAPLRSISGFSQVLMEDYGDRLDAEGHGALLRIVGATQRMATLIDDILGLSRLTRGELQREELNLSDVAQSVVEEVRLAYPGRNVSFIVASGLSANGDPTLMRTALTNLLDNAWKYSGKRLAAQVEFGAFDDADGRTVFFVKDDGTGFDMAYADKLFGAFQRLHGMQEFPGNGIGLATVQRIVHKHGGDIWAEAAVGKGATFFFTLGQRRQP